MDLRSAQREVDAYISQFKEGYFPPLVNLARLTEEVGELASALRNGTHEERLGEFADVIAWLTTMTGSRRRSVGGRKLMTSARTMPGTPATMNICRHP